jgi:hypothetical protein
LPGNYLKYNTNFMREKFLAAIFSPPAGVSRPQNA